VTTYLEKLENKKISGILTPQGSVRVEILSWTSGHYSVAADGTGFIFMLLSL